ncbi:class I SAM-dependent RNA methyltransferase [uncultured Marivita sp.]|jgi:putative N6-adenine-specific DNA methylase|uniref:THUMP domain-containing class I SAM-dependent RNA methyltransferase n=1 Tax=Marivita sp. TaxID=2003365 RepID=UPI0025CC7A39|nr:class I SAM-dependent RNA methyltransferase [uncultured Marivita sp.]MCR9110400.1 class I SAM-dependent RNA methyltransferase [Paracoccaceae bacterium]
MTQDTPLEIFLSGTPGFEHLLRDEAAALGFANATAVPGGVTCDGDWSEVWRANLMLRGASRVLARIARFRAMHLAQLDKRARKIDWPALLRADVPYRVEATCRKSRIYHAGAATQRVETAIADALGSSPTEKAGLTIRVRIEDDLCEISLDTSGEGLHKRGHKHATGKAPMRETLSALFLRACGYDGSEPVIDPMCGSGTFVIEAAEGALGLAPGRARRFGFEDLASFDAIKWAELKSALPAPQKTDLRFYGFDRDAGAIANATANAERAGVSEITTFTHQAVTDLTPPEGPPGLVIVNPPYGARIGNRKLLFALYGSFGTVMKERFKGWRVGIVTSDKGLARTTGLHFHNVSAPIPHGGLKVQLFQTGPLK